jgi:hypothetical protein
MPVSLYDARASLIPPPPPPPPHTHTGDQYKLVLEFHQPELVLSALQAASKLPAFPRSQDQPPSPAPPAAAAGPSSPISNDDAWSPAVLKLAKRILDYTNGSTKLPQQLIGLLGTRVTYTPYGTGSGQAFIDLLKELLALHTTFAPDVSEDTTTGIGHPCGNRFCPLISRAVLYIPFDEESVFVQCDLGLLDPQGAGHWEDVAMQNSSLQHAAVVMQMVKDTRDVDKEMVRQELLGTGVLDALWKGSPQQVVVGFAVKKAFGHSSYKALKKARKALAQASALAAAGGGGSSSSAEDVAAKQHACDAAAARLHSDVRAWASRFEQCVRGTLLADLPAARALPASEAQHKVDTLLSQGFTFLPVCKPGMLPGTPWLQQLCSLVRKEHARRQQPAVQAVLQARQQRGAARASLELASQTLAHHSSICCCAGTSSRDAGAVVAGLQAVASKLEQRRAGLQAQQLQAHAALQRSVCDALTAKVQGLMASTPRAAGITAVVKELVPLFATDSPAFQQAVAGSGSGGEALKEALKAGAFHVLYDLSCTTRNVTTLLQKGVVVGPDGGKVALQQLLFPALFTADTLDVEVGELKLGQLQQQPAGEGTSCCLLPVAC